MYTYDRKKIIQNHQQVINTVASRHLHQFCFRLPASLFRIIHRSVSVQRLFLLLQESPSLSQVCSLLVILHLQLTQFLYVTFTLHLDVVQHSLFEICQPLRLLYNQRLHICLGGLQCHPLFFR